MFVRLPDDDDLLPDIDLPPSAPNSTNDQPTLNDDELDVAWAELDERQRSLELNPELAEMEDNGYEWTTSNWDGLPAIVPIGARGRVLPEEDVEKVTGTHCKICADRITHAAVLKCMHMLCINCFENRAVEKCPFCQAIKVFKAMCNLSTISIDRIVEEPDVPIAIPPVSLAEQRERPVASHEDRNNEAIDEALRQSGVDDPVAYRAQLRRAHRQRRERGPRRNYVVPTADEDNADERQETDEPERHDDDQPAPSADEDNDDERQETDEQERHDDDQTAPAADDDQANRFEVLGFDDEDFFAEVNAPTENSVHLFNDVGEPTNNLADDSPELDPTNSETVNHESIAIEVELGDDGTDRHQDDEGHQSDDSLFSYQSTSQMTLRSSARNRRLIDDSEDDDADAPSVRAPKKRRRHSAKKSRGGRRE